MKHLSRKRRRKQARQFARTEAGSYLQFVADCGKRCRCYHYICDGVLAGGLCDDIQPTWDADEDNRYWES